MFTEKFDKINEGKLKSRTINLRGLVSLSLLFLVINFSVFSQGDPVPPPPVELDIQSTTTGYYKCYVDGVYVDIGEGHTSMSKADAHCTTISYNHPNKIVGFKHPNFTQIKVKNQPKSIEIDTIQVNRRLDVDSVPVRPFRDVVMGGQCYILTHEVGMVQFQCDSLPNWQTKYNLKQTKIFGKISYENLTIPFQYMDVWFINPTETTIELWCEITEQYIHINSWIDGVQFKEFNRPNADGNNPFMFGITGLVQEQEYEFKMEVKNAAGEIIVYQTTLKL